MLAVLTLGLGQFAVFVVGLPLLVLFFLRRNRRVQGGLTRHAIQVRYGLFFAAYKDNAYFWEIVLAARKIAIVGVSVFGRSIGTQRQAQLALFILFLCVSLEIAGKPYRIVTERHKVLGQLELASLFTLWGTMWCGTLIFASQAPSDAGFVIFLSVLVATMNVGMLLWLVYQLIAECAFENKESRAGQLVIDGLKRLKRIKSLQSFRRKRKVEQKISGSRATKPQTLTVQIGLNSSSVNPIYGKNAQTTKKTSGTENAAESARDASAVPSSSSDAGWSRHFDEVSGSYFYCDEGTGETKWEESEEESEEGMVMRYYLEETLDGEFYYVPESGDGESVWHLPEGAELVD